MQLDLIDASGSAVQKLEASDAVFARAYNEALVHQVVVAYQANARQGTRAQKGRSDIAKSTRKPWKQKGSGQARAGRASSPLWRGGGRIFASSPDENFTHKINRRMYRAAMAAILSKLVSDGRLAVLEKLEIEAPKTKLFHEKVKALGLQSVMFVTDDADENVLMAARNLPNVLVTESKYIDPLSLIFYKKTLLTRAALARIEEMFA